MSRKCELTGKEVMFGNTVSNANNRNRTRFFPSLASKRFYVPELKKFVRAKISRRGMRTVDKLGGLYQAAISYRNTLSTRLKKELKVG